MEVLTNQQVPYLLTPVLAPPRTDLVTILSHVKNPKVELQFLFDRPSHEPLIVDLETQGTKAFVSATAIVGIGFADSRGSLYVDLLTSSPDTLPFLIREMDRLRVPLVAHNVAFDGVFLLRDSAKIWPETGGRWLNWVTCTYALYRHVATEKFIGQQYGLKKAQVDLLGWEESNEVELDKWLIDNGYSTGKGDKLSPDKSQMWRAPCEILGKYCAMDCDSTFSLFHKVLAPVMEKFPKLRTYHETYFMKLEELLARQQLSGIKIDVPQLVVYRKDLLNRTEMAADAFLSLPRVKKFTEKKIKQEKLNLISDEPEKFKKKKERTEPVKHKKDGGVSNAWLSWEKAESAPREVTVAWKKWDQKVREFNGDGLFNINSDLQLRDLFYTELKYPILELTDTGLASVGVDALKGFGEEGKALDYFRELEKELQYVDGCLDYVALSDDKETLHPVFRVPGTHTGRLSGGQGKNEKGPKVNVQQIPHSVGYLSCWKPRPGMKWISADFAALEGVILAALSGDPSLLLLYGEGAKENDLHLFLGATIPGLKEPILAAGYDPKNPTPEGIANAKKLCKKERGIAKTANYALQYGAGVPSIHASLIREGIDATREMAQIIYDSYHELYKVSKQWARWLERFHGQSGGWVPTALGRPTTLWNERLKDLASSVVQLSGHDAHVLFCYLWSKLFAEAGIYFNGIVVDFHDESIIEVPEDRVEEACELLKEATRKLNEMLDCQVKLSTDPKVISSMAEAKCEG